MIFRDDRELVEEGDRFFDEGDLESAESCYLEAIRINPEQFNAYYSLGALYYNRSEYYTSLTFSEKAKEIDPENQYVRFNIGLALNMLNDNEEAVAEFTRAVELKPDYALAHFALANTLLGIGRLKEAQYYYSRAVKFKVKYDNVWFLWGRVFFLLGEYNLAGKCFETFYTILSRSEIIEPDLSEKTGIASLLIEMGKTEFYLNRVFTAKKYFIMALEEENEDFYLNKTEVYLYLVIMEKRSGSSGRVDEYRHRILEFSREPYAFLTCEIYSCPKSPVFFIKKNLRTPKDDNNLWSDLYPAQSDLGKEQILTYCSVCRCYHHVAELEYLMGIPAVDYPEYLNTIDYDDFLDIEDYKIALLQQWPGEREIEIRKRFLWKLNHFHRNGEEIEHLVGKTRRDNIESLLELIRDEMKNSEEKEDNERSLFFAELLRESGRYDACVKEISKHFKNDDHIQREFADMIKSAALKKNSLPFAMFDEISSGNISFDLKKIRENSVIVYPEIEDVFAFCDSGKMDRYNPFLSIDLSMIDESLKGWATFTCRTEALLHRYGRLFTEEEWLYFKSLEKRCQEELIWFWSFKSWGLPEETKDLDRYYKVRSVLSFRADYKLMGYESFDSYNSFICKWKDEEEENWERLKENKDQWTKEERRWYEGRKYRLLWDSILSVLDGAEGVSTFLDLKKLVDDDIELFRRSEEEKKEAAEGLKYFQTKPSWFQGHDMTPFNSNGDEYFFVGQIWTDYLNVCGSKLIYLFYDPLDKRQVEEYDYD